MIGLRGGLAAGVMGGFRVGVGADPIAPQGAQTTQTVTVADSADPVITGADAFSYTVQYTNTGSNNATTVSIAVTLDASLTYVSSSGTGWGLSQAAGVVTCTMASAAPGAANPITINVTTGTGAVTASTSAVATAANAPTANGSQGTTVNLVSKDATAGIYTPASSTEWTNFIARKGLSAAVPTNLWLMQEASGNLADSIGSRTGTKNGTPAYQQAATGWTRTGIKPANAATDSFQCTITALNTSSGMMMQFVVLSTVAPAAARGINELGNVTVESAKLTTAGKLEGRSSGNIADSSTVYTSGATLPIVSKYDHTGASFKVYGDKDKLVPTFATTTGTTLVFCGDKSSACDAVYVYTAWWDGSNAELSDANVKALLQALGWTISWS